MAKLSSRRKLLAILITAGVAAGIALLGGTRLSPTATSPPSPASWEPAQTGTVVHVRPPWYLGSVLQSKGLPVSGVWVWPDTDSGVTVTRPLTEAELQLVLEVVPRPLILYREYGPHDYPCDNPDGPVRVWSGWSTGTRYRTLIRSTSDLGVDLQRALQEALTDRPYRLGVAGYLATGLLGPVGTDGRPHTPWLVVSADTSPPSEELEFLRSVFPADTPIEVWAGITKTRYPLIEPHQVTILCGDTRYT